MSNDSLIDARLLGTLTSALYEGPIVIFREYVQNSLDAYNEVIDNEEYQNVDELQVNIEIDSVKKTITITDNGYAIKQNDFEKKMKTLGASDKTQKQNFIGFRGIGRLSALLFCDKLTFYSKYRGEEYIYMRI